MQVITWVRENWKTSIEIVAVAIVAVAVILGARAYWTSRSTNGADALYAAEQLEAGSEAQLKALAEVADDYGRTAAGKQAFMRLGDLYLSNQAYDKAQGAFRDLAGHSRNTPMLNIAALHRLADAQLASGDSEAAVGTFLKAAADPHNLLKNTSRLRAGECLEREGKYDEAASLYRQVIDESGEDDLAIAQRSEERLLWLIANKHIAVSNG